MPVEKQVIDMAENGMGAKNPMKPILTNTPAG